MDRIIANGRILDPLSGRDEIGCLWIREGRISKIVSGTMERPGGVEWINAEGSLVVPGLIDLHVHLRDPGGVWKEDVVSGLRAAAAGGYTTVCCMPNTEPPIDNENMVRSIDEKAKKAEGPNLLLVAAMTLGQKGIDPVEIKKLMRVETRCKELLGRGICAISEDGKSLEDDHLYLKIMIMAMEQGLPIFSHAEARSDEDSEALGVDRDLQLAKRCGVPIHFCHISTEKSLKIIRKEMSRGTCVTCEATPHHCTLSKEEASLHGNWKMNPPLARKQDQQALTIALESGEIVAIATDHAPHALWEKERSYENCPAGVIGLETAFPMCYTELVESERLGLMDLIHRMTLGPAQVLGLDRGHLKVGGAADVTVIDVSREYVIQPRQFFSKSWNTPFAGRVVKGYILWTIVEGRTIYNGYERLLERSHYD